MKMAMDDGVRFGAPWAAVLKVTSAFFTVLLLGIGLFFLQTVASDPRTPPSMKLLALPFSLMWFACLLFTIRGYTLRRGRLHVHRLLWDTVIDLADLREATVDPHAMDGSIRLFGNGGAFSFSGLFSNRRLGAYRAFATDPGRAVVLRFPKKTFVVTPDRPDEFLAQLALHCPCISKR